MANAARRCGARSKGAGKPCRGTAMQASRWQENRPPLEEAVDRHDAAAPAVGITKARQVPYGLALGVDRFVATRRVIAPIGDEAPTERVERHISRLVIAANDQQFLAGCAVPSRWIVVQAVIAHVHAIDDGIPQRSAALDDPPTHAADIVIRGCPHQQRGMARPRSHCDNFACTHSRSRGHR
jgi:hypothetical protein